MPCWYYFAKPTNFAYHDLREDKTTKLPRSVISLLGLSLKFCPTPRLTPSKTDVENTISRYQRDLFLKHYFKNDAPLDAPKDLRLYARSTWTPPEWNIHNELKLRMKHFGNVYRNMMKLRNGQTNLLSHHREGLRFLQSSHQLMTVTCDKNLGPAVIDIPTYIKYAYRDHLKDETTY